MKTMQEVQAMLRDLQQLYTDVRLLDRDAIARIEEGPQRRRSVLCLPPQEPPLPPLRREKRL